MLEAVNVIQDISFLIFISVVNKELKHSHTYLFSWESRTKDPE